MKDRSVEIKFLYFSGCPHSEKALALVREVLAELHIQDYPRSIEIDNESDALANRFLGSPTIQINGKDIETSRKVDSPLFGCRIYKTASGLTGVPPKEMILAAVKEALEQQIRKKG
jgi:glutaredoxin